jgi:tetratricopeptide (TPR) repeat protein
LLYIYHDFVKTIDNGQKAASLHRGSQLPQILRDLGEAYLLVGFVENFKECILEAFQLDGDSVEYYRALGEIEFFYLQNFVKALDFYEKVYAIDTIRGCLELATTYMFLGQNEESLVYYKKHLKRQEAQGAIVLVDMQRIGYAYWVNGYKKEAEYYFEKQIEYSNNEIQLGRYRSEYFFSYYNLAGVYAFLGEKDKAYENLRIFNQNQIMAFWMVWYIKKDPLFDSIRDEPEFQEIVRDVEVKYQAEHERVRKWLEEQGML